MLFLCVCVALWQPFTFNRPLNIQCDRHISTTHAYMDCIGNNNQFTSHFNCNRKVVKDDRLDVDDCDDAYYPRLMSFFTSDERHFTTPKHFDCDMEEDYGVICRFVLEAMKCMENISLETFANIMEYPLHKVGFIITSVSKTKSNDKFWIFSQMLLNSLIKINKYYKLGFYYHKRPGPLSVESNVNDISAHNNNNDNNEAVVECKTYFSRSNGERMLETRSNQVVILLVKCVLNDFGKKGSYSRTQSLILLNDVFAGFTYGNGIRFLPYIILLLFDLVAVKKVAKFILNNMQHMSHGFTHLSNYYIFVISHVHSKDTNVLEVIDNLIKKTDTSYFDSIESVY